MLIYLIETFAQKPQIAVLFCINTLVYVAKLSYKKERFRSRFVLWINSQTPFEPYPRYTPRKRTHKDNSEIIIFFTVRL